MLRRYRKIKGDMPLLAAEDRGQYQVLQHNYCLLSPSIFIYLLLSPLQAEHAQALLSALSLLSLKKNIVVVR
jgi:hypothetical protein